MRGLVRDDVVGEATEDGLPRARPPVALVGREVAEEQGVEAGVVERVRVLHRVGEDPQAGPLPRAAPAIRRVHSIGRPSAVPKFSIVFVTTA